MPTSSCRTRKTTNRGRPIIGINNTGNQASYAAIVFGSVKFWEFGPEFVQSVLNFTGKIFKRRMENECVVTVESVLQEN